MRKDEVRSEEDLFTTVWDNGNGLIPHIRTMCRKFYRDGRVWDGRQPVGARGLAFFEPYDDKPSWRFGTGSILGMALSRVQNCIDMGWDMDTCKVAQELIALAYHLWRMPSLVAPWKGQDDWQIKDGYIICEGELGSFLLSQVLPVERIELDRPPKVGDFVVSKHEGVLGQVTSIEDGVLTADTEAYGGGHYGGSRFYAGDYAPSSYQIKGAVGEFTTVNLKVVSPLEVPPAPAEEFDLAAAVAGLFK